MKEESSFPKSALECGGLIGRIMDYTLDQSHRPNEKLAFAGALAWLSHCMGRVYRTETNGRPNLYILAHAWSGVGKSAPRYTNFKLAKSCGLVGTVIEDFRSGEALQDSILSSAKILSQYDECDTLFETIKRSRDGGVGINTMGEMLKEWEKSGSYLVRRKLSAAGKAVSNDRTPGIVYHPHLALFMTGVTSEVYNSMSEKMAKNGFFARLLIIDGGKRGESRIPVFKNPPDDIISASKTLCRFQEDRTTWLQLRGDWEGTGAIIPTDTDGARVREEFRKVAEAHYNEDEDGPYNTVWNRTMEKAEKLAMVFAASDNQEEPVITARHWEAARDLVTYSNAHQLAMLSKYSSDTDYEDLQKRILRRLEKGITSSRSMLMALHIKGDDLREVAETLRDAGQIIFCEPNGEEVPEYRRGVSFALA